MKHAHRDDWELTLPYDSDSDPEFALNVMRRWNLWIQNEGFKDHQAPWDPRVDTSDDDAKEGEGGGGGK